MHLGGDAGRMGLVQVAPAVLEHLVAAEPRGRPGEEHLEGLGEARLARPVAPDDDREAAPGVQRQGLRGPDTAEALCGDRGEERAHGFGCGPVGRPPFGPRRRTAAHRVGQRLVTLARGQQKFGRPLGQLRVAINPPEDDVEKSVIHARRLRAGCDAEGRCDRGHEGAASPPAECGASRSSAVEWDGDREVGGRAWRPIGVKSRDLRRSGCPAGGRAGRASWSVPVSERHQEVPDGRDRAIAERRVGARGPLSAGPAHADALGVGQPGAGRGPQRGRLRGHPLVPGVGRGGAAGAGRRAPNDSIAARTLLQSLLGGPTPPSTGPKPVCTGPRVGQGHWSTIAAPDPAKVSCSR